MNQPTSDHRANVRRGRRPGPEPIPAVFHQCRAVGRRAFLIVTLEEPDPVVIMWSNCGAEWAQTDRDDAADRQRHPRIPATDDAGLRRTQTVFRPRRHDWHRQHEHRASLGEYTVRRKDLRASRPAVREGSPRVG
jgi:hypothetical protein